MLTAIDHIIIGVQNLEKAALQFSQKLGLAVSGGGTHPTGGTANRIIVIGDTYLELIAIHNSAEAQQSMLDRLAIHEGYLNFVLASNDIEADSNAMINRGIQILGPIPGSLRAADGRTRGWSRVDVERPDLAQRYPFIIQHDSTGEERRFRLAGWTTPPEHALGATQVRSTTIAVANLAEATQRYQHIYGLQPSDSFTGEADGWDAMLAAFPLGGNDQGQCFELAEPLSLSAEADQDVDYEHLPEPGALARHLVQFGESLCRMTLAVDDLDNSRRYLDESGVTYTYQTMPRPVIWIHPDYACGASIVLHQDTE
ncbi:MAG TPA: VOC family protein [Ktedonobacteraceae bacterium]|nr:VOC family protein [Ktedonobacteraceae bacterium]